MPLMSHYGQLKRVGSAKRALEQHSADLEGESTPSKRPRMDEPQAGPSQRPSQVFNQADKAYMSRMTIPSRSGKQLKFDMAVTQYISEGNLAFNHVASTAFKNLIASPQRSAFETSLENHNINSHISYKLDSCALYKSYPWWYKNHYLFWLQGKQTFSENSLKTQLSFKLLARTINLFHLSCKCGPNAGFFIQIKICFCDKRPMLFRLKCQK